MRPIYSAVVVAMALYLGLGDCPDCLHAAQTSAPPTAATPAWPTLEPVWQIAMPGAPAAAGVMDAERLYIPLRTSALVALSRDAGATIWSREIETAWPAVFHENAVFVAARDGIHALGAANGAPLSTAINDAPYIPLASEPAGPMTLAGDLVLVPADDSTLIAANVRSGRISWQTPLGAVSHRRAAIGPDGVAFLSLADARLVALSLADGHIRWTQQLTGTLSEPSAARDRVFVGSTDNVVRAFDAGTGESLWNKATGGDVVGTAADEDAVYIASLDNVLWALNRGNGNQRWHQIISARPLWAPQLRGRLLMLDGVGPSVTAYSLATGSPAGTFAAAGDLADTVLAGPPLLAASTDQGRVMVVLVMLDGRVVALGPTEAKPTPPSK